MKQSFLLTGATGFLGHIFLTEFHKNKLPLEPIADNKGNRIDISKPFDLKPDSNANVIIHAAGKAHIMKPKASDSALFYQVNFEGTRNLCQAIERLESKPQSLIFISTVAVYGLASGEMIKETHPLNGTSSYAKSKIMAEDFLKKWAEKQDIKLGILRLPLIVGPNSLGNLAAMINGIRSGRYLSIGKASARKSMVWGADVAHIIPILAEKGGIYNLTDDYHPSFRELENAIAVAFKKQSPLKIPFAAAKALALIGDIVGSKFPLNNVGLKKITSSLTFDDSKARLDLSWNPSPVLDNIHNILKL